VETVTILVRQGARIALGIGVATVSWGSLAPGEALPTLEMWDKSQHMLTYAGLGVFAAIGFPRTRGLIFVAAGLAVLGCLLEGAQAYVPGRLASAGDALANIIGLVAGLVATRLAGYLGERLGHSISR